MKKNLLAIALVLLLGCLSICTSDAKAFGGSMSCSMTITVYVNKPNAKLTLVSTKGTAKVNAHILSLFSRTKNENHHGFYLVQGSGFGGSLRWTPSATKNKLDPVGMTQQKRTEKITLTFRNRGEYKVTVKPMSFSEINNLWRIDTIRSWVKYPRWNVIDMDGCTITVR